MSETTQANGHTQETLVPSMQVEPMPEKHPGHEGDWPPADAVLRLLLGFALEGRDQLNMRVRQWDAAVRASSPESEGMPSLVDQQRSTTFGMLQEAQADVREIVRSALGISSEIGTRVLDGAEFLLRHWPFDLLRPRLDALRRDFEAAVDAWAALGRREEELGRQMARQAVVSLMDELFDYMAKNPEVRELIEQQGVGLAETAVDGVRVRTASADALVERLVRGMFRHAPEPPSTVVPDAPPPRSGAE